MKVRPKLWLLLFVAITFNSVLSCQGGRQNNEGSATTIEAKMPPSSVQVTQRSDTCEVRSEAYEVIGSSFNDFKPSSDYRELKVGGITMQLSSLDTNTNIHDATTVDSIIHYRYGSSRIDIFKNTTQNFVLGAEIVDSIIPLSKGVRIGDSIEKVSRLLDIDPKPSVGTKHLMLFYETVAQHHLHFESGVLTKVSLNFWVD